MVEDDGVTVTDATTGGADVTVIVAVPWTDPVVAVIVAEPAETACTMPAFETVATDVFDEDHVNVAPESTAPTANAVAANCAESPACTIAVGGDMPTESAGGGSTATPTDAVTPSAIAVMVALPR